MPDRRAPIRVREELLPPAPLESRAPRPKVPPEVRAETINSMAAIMDRRRLALEIQQTCGAVPLTEDEGETFSALRELHERHSRNRPAELRRFLEPAAAERAAAYKSLVRRLPCSHCAARAACPAAHAQRMN